MQQHYAYEIVLESQLGPRYGTLSMEEQDDVINGTLSLLEFENSVSGKRKGQEIYLNHTLRTLVSQISCHSDLELQGNSLVGTIYSDYGSMTICGRKMAEKECQTK